MLGIHPSLLLQRRHQEVRGVRLLGLRREQQQFCVEAELQGCVCERCVRRGEGRNRSSGVIVRLRKKNNQNLKRKKKKKKKTLPWKPGLGSKRTVPLCYAVNKVATQMISLTGRCVCVPGRKIRTSGGKTLRLRRNRNNRITFTRA